MLPVSSYGYIYVIENDINNKLYVGRTLDLRKREAAHFSSSSRTWAIKAAIAKYGPEHFDFVILEPCSCEEELNAKEIYWIGVLGTITPLGYNLKEGGKSGRPSAIVREKLRAAHRGVSLSAEHKQSISKSLMGKVVLDETRQKISKGLRGRKHSEESRLKMSEARLGKKLSLKTRQRMSVSQKGKHYDSPSGETRLKMSRALLGRKLSTEHCQNISRALRGNANARK